MAALFRPDFNPAPNQPCLCQSGNLFSQCCGSKELNRKLPVGMTLIPGFISASECDDLIVKAKTLPYKEVLAEAVDQETGQTKLIADSGRITQELNLTEIRGRVNQYLSKIVTEVIEPAYNVKIEWFEPVGLLRYLPGGRFVAHADAETYVAGRGKWQKTRDRDFSILLYLNDDFEGGSIDFKKFNFGYKPRQGDLIVFPSDNRYVHEAHTVTHGERYVMVSWATVVGSARLHDHCVVDGSIFM